MPSQQRTHHRTIEVDADYFPPPAVKLVITQYLETNWDPPFWAWIIVGAFYDCHEQIIWSTEIFVAHLDIQYYSDESDDEEDVTGFLDSEESSDAASGSPPTHP